MKTTKRSIIQPIIIALLSVCMIVCFICYASKGFVNDKVDTTTEKINTVSEQIMAINGSIDVMKVADTEMNGYIDALETAVAKLESDLVATNDKITELEESIEEAEYATVTQLTETKTALEGQIATANTAIETLKSNDRTQDGKITALETAKASLESEISAIKNRLDIVEEALSNINSCTCDTSLYATKTQLTEAKTTLENQLASVNTAIKALRSVNVEVDTAITTIEDKIDALSEQLVANANADQTTKTALRADIATLNTAVKALKSKDTTIDEKISALEIANTSLDGKIVAVNTAIEELKAADAEINADITALETSVDTLEDELATTKTTIDTVKAELEDAIEEVETTVLAQLDTLKTATESDIATLKADVAALKAKDLELDQKISDLQTYVDNELANYATVDWANATFATLQMYLETQQTIADIELEIKNINDAMTALETRINKKIATDIKAAIDALRTELGADYATKIEVAVEGVTSEYEAAIKAAGEEIKAAYTVAIKEAVDGLKTEMIDWVNGKLEQPLKDIAALQADLNALISTAATDDELAAAVEAQEKALKEAIDNLTAAYKDAINGSIDDLKRVDGELKGYIENLERTAEGLQNQLDATSTKIDSIKKELNDEIDAVEQNLLGELNKLKTDIEGEIANIKGDIEYLKEKDLELDQRISGLQTYVDNELANYATADWANATFATLQMYLETQQTIADIELEIKNINDAMTALETRINKKIATDIKAAIDALRTELGADYATKIEVAVEGVTSEYEAAIKTAGEEIKAAYTVAIKEAVDGLKTEMMDWVNGKLEQPLKDIAALQADLNALISTAATDDELAAAVEAQEKALKEAIDNLTAAYKDAIKKAIDDNNGEIDTKIANAIATAKYELNASIDDIELRVATLETKVEEHNDKIAELETKVEEHNDKIAELETKVEEHNDKIAELEQKVENLETKVNCLMGVHVVESYTINNDGTHTYTCTACGQTVTEEHNYVDNYACECGDKIEITSLSFIIDDVEYDSTNTSASEPARITGSCKIKIKLYGTNLNLINLSHSIKAISTIGWLIDAKDWTFNADNTEATETYSLGDFDEQTTVFELKYKNPIDGWSYVNSGVYYVYDVEAFWGEAANRLTTAGTLTDALASDATYIKLEKSLMLTDAIVIAASKTLTIDFNTYTLTTASGKNGFTNNGTLTLLNGTITDNNTTTYAVENAATLTMTDMTVTGGYPLYQTGVSATLTNTTLKNQGTATTRTGCYVQSGSVTATNCAFEGRYGLYAAKGTQWTSKGQITLNDCSFKGSWGLRINEGFDLTLTGDTTFINADPYSSFWALYISSSDMTVDLSGMTSGLTNMKIDMFYVKKIYIKLPEGYGAYNVYNEQINLSNGLTSAIQLTIKETAN